MREKMPDETRAISRRDASLRANLVQPWQPNYFHRPDVFSIWSILLYILMISSQQI